MSFLLLRFSADSNIHTYVKQRIFICCEIVSLFLIGFNGILHLKRILCWEQHIIILSINNNSSSRKSSASKHLNKSIFIEFIFSRSLIKGSNSFRSVTFCYVSLNEWPRYGVWEWMKNWPWLSRAHAHTITSLLICIEEALLPSWN